MTQKVFQNEVHIYLFSGKESKADRYGQEYDKKCKLGDTHVLGFFGILSQFFITTNQTNC